MEFAMKEQSGLSDAGAWWTAQKLQLSSLKKKKLIESKPTDHVEVTVKTAVDLSSRLPEAVFFRWPLVNENGARNNIVNLMINKLREDI